MVNEGGECRGGVEGFAQPALVAGEQIGIIGGVSAPGAPAVGRRYHIREHKHIVLCFPEAVCAAAAATVGHSQLCEAVVAVEQLEHRLCIAATVGLVLAAQGQFAKLQGGAADHTVLVGHLPFGLQVTVDRYKAVDGSAGRGFIAGGLLLPAGGTLGVGKFQQTLGRIDHGCVVGVAVHICPVVALAAHQVGGHPLAKVEVGLPPVGHIAVGQHPDCRRNILYTAAVFVWFAGLPVEHFVDNHIKPHVEHAVGGRLRHYARGVEGGVEAIPALHMRCRFLFVAVGGAACQLHRGAPRIAHIDGTRSAAASVAHLHNLDTGVCSAIHSAPHTVGIGLIQPNLITIYGNFGCRAPYIYHKRIARRARGAPHIYHRCARMAVHCLLKCLGSVEIDDFHRPGALFPRSELPLVVRMMRRQRSSAQHIQIQALHAVPEEPVRRGALIA